MLDSTMTLAIIGSGTMGEAIGHALDGDDLATAAKLIHEAVSSVEKDAK